MIENMIAGRRTRGETRKTDTFLCLAPLGPPHVALNGPCLRTRTRSCVQARTRASREGFRIRESSKSLSGRGRFPTKTTAHGLAGHPAKTTGREGKI